MVSPTKRISVRTEKGADWDKDRAKSRSKGEAIARTKKVRAEDAELEAQELDAEYLMESPVKKAPKPTAKAPVKQAAPRLESSDMDEDEEARNIAEVIADEKRCLQLQYMIHGRDSTPLDKLQTRDLPELEKLWEDGLSGARPTAPTQGKAKASSAPAKKPAAAPSKKPPAKTPAKIRASKVLVSKVTPLDSPLLAFKQAQEQSMRADSTPVPSKRTRDPSVDSNAEVRRPRLDIAGMRFWYIAQMGITNNLYDIISKSGISRISAPTTRAPSFDRSTTASRASSMAPGAMSARSQSSASSKSAARAKTLGYDDGEVFNLNFDDAGIEDEVEEVRVVEPGQSGGKKKGKKPPKPRAKKSDYNKDPQMKIIIDRTVEETAAIIAPDMCNDELELPIRKGWARALIYLHLSGEDFPITQHSIDVCKSLVHGFRSRGRHYLNPIVASHYGLELGELDIDQVKAKAAKLIPDEFHRDPKEKDPDAGHYRNPILARGIAVIWMKGNKPTATRFPDLLNPVPDRCIAYTAALIHDIIGRIAKDGFIKVEPRSKTEEEKQEKARQRAIAKAKGEIIRPAVDPMKTSMDDHLHNLQVFEEVMGDDYHTWRADLFKRACKCAGTYKGGSDAEEDEPEQPRKQGRLTAASFAAEKARKDLALASNSNASRKPTAKPPAAPPRSSTLQQIEEQSEADSPARPSSSRPLTGRASSLGYEKSRSTMAQGSQDTDESDGTPSDKEPDGGRERTSKPIKRSVPAAIDDEDSRNESEGEPDGPAEAGEPDGTSRTAAKRKPRPQEAPLDNKLDPQASEKSSTSEDEKPVKKRRLLKAPTLNALGSDDEDEQMRDGGGGGERELVPPAVEGPPDATSDPPSAKQRLTEAVPSSPLSDSPADPPVFVKRSTRSSNPNTNDAPSAQAVMQAALEKHRKVEAEKRERAAKKKKEAERESKESDAAWEGLECEAKEAQPVKVKVKVKAKANNPKKAKK
ncbi:hypothetical protein RhiJN_01630 [Ceratobasidium sp. AG-Ba]|nr:hypothetical protein RhiJN_01630 [Ceratobasidium sp. AG-Ba]